MEHLTLRDPIEFTENILVISDLHLGESLANENTPGAEGYIRILNKELSDFIRYYECNRRNNLPWHLVIDGDMVDFLRLVGSDPECSVDYQHELLTILKNVLYVHRPLFRELGHFLLAGNRVTIVEGNHDAELYFQEIRNCITSYVITLLDASRENFTPEEVSRQISSRLTFRSWFQVEIGRYHIEHGHQYDAFCSFEYQLAPYDSGPSERLMTPMTQRAVPFFGELLAQLSTHSVEHWTFGQFMRFAWQQGPRLCLLLFKFYFLFGIELLTKSGERRRKELDTWKIHHRNRLLEMSASAPYGLKTLEALDALKATPAEFSTWKMLNCFYLDRILIFSHGLFFSLMIELLGGKSWRFLHLVVWGLVGLVVRWLSQDREAANIPMLLRRAAWGIANTTGAPCVVFGHSHHPERVDLNILFGHSRDGAPAIYINSGSWVTNEGVRGEKGKGMTFVEINGNEAMLCRWCGEKTGPEVLG